MPKDSIQRMKRTVLYQELRKREAAGEGNEVSERVAAVVEQVAPLLERIPDKMPEFTLHDPNHSAKVAELMSQIIPEDTLAHLNLVELSILLYAAYLHDVGMTCTRAEREEIIRNGDDFKRLLISDEERSQQIEKAKMEGDHRTATFLEDQIFTEYLRRNHVKRSAKFIEEHFSSEETALSWQGTPYQKLVRAVCDSHELPVERLRDTRIWPREALVRNLRVNVQYLSLVLRLADILDLDPERTPKALLDFIDPQNPTSITEWNKHRSVKGWEVTPERIEFQAQYPHPVYERALREFMEWIEIERRDSVALANSSRDELSKIYRFDLTYPVTTDGITSDGTYIYSDLRFAIDHKRVLNLLMGERLYGNPILALRELLQNAIDAVRCREALEKQEGQPFTPEITIRLEDSRLIVEDNGIGMDDYIFKNYFMQVGRSYYRSPEFRARDLGVEPVSEFGIGILSVFMVADGFTVESRRRPDNALEPPQPIHVEVPKAYDYFVQRPTDRRKIGTTIILSLKSNHPFKQEKLEDSVADLAPFIDYPISIFTPEESQYVPQVPGERLPPEAAEVLLSIPLDDTEDQALIGVRGRFDIVTGRIWGSNEVLAQEGFAIRAYDGFGYEYLIPEWLSGILSIDLRGTAKLSLTPSRTRVVEDGHFRQLRSLIDVKIARAWREHLEGYRDSNSLDQYRQYVDKLFYTGAWGARIQEVPRLRFTGSDEAKLAFLDLVPLALISSDERRTICYGNELLDTPCILIAAPEGWPKNVSEHEVAKTVSAAYQVPPPVLLDTSPAYIVRRGIFKALVGQANGYVITNLPGVVLEVIDRDESHPKDFTIEHSHTYSWGIKDLNSANDPLLINVGRGHVQSSTILNARHPIFTPFIDVTGPRNEHSERFLMQLSSTLSRFIWEELKEEAAKFLISGREGPGVEVRANELLIGVTHRNPQLLSSIRDALRGVWQEAQEANAISADLPFPELTEADLPWFWSYDQGTMNIVDTATGAQM